MPIRSSLVATIMLCAAWGYATQGEAKDPPPGASHAPCGQANCPIKVTVGDNCTVRTDPDVLDLTGPKQPRTIKWTIVTPRFTFSQNTSPGSFGIFIKGGGASLFGTPRVNGNAADVDYPQKTTGNRFEYGVNVVDRNGNVCPTLDPWIFD